MANIIRVFRAETKVGMEDEFRDFFVHEALPFVRSFSGLVSAVVGLPQSPTPRSFLMISIWSSLASLKEFAGENWTEAVIDPREAHLLANVDVSHYVESSA